MSTVYLDTNIFLYLSDITSPFHADCVNLILYCQQQNTRVTTSVETIQEIIHFAKNTKQLKTGIEVSQTTLSLVDGLFDITNKSINEFLEKVEVYSSAKSRDVLHLSVCIENQIHTIITYDGDFDIFKEVEVFSAKEYLAQHD